MTMTEWAEREIAAACKRENPNWDGKSFDYGCSCYQSALKAYNSLMNDGHSGFSFSVTRNILKKLLDNIPLSSITDDDFFVDGVDFEESPEYLKERGLKSDIQCPRRSSLFRQEDLEGNVKYTDVDRCYCVNAESPLDTFTSSTSNFIDELYPITMPYVPSSEQFKVYVREWLTDKTHGDFDVVEVIGYEDQKGQWHDYSKFIYDDGNGLHEITNEDIKQKLIASRLTSIEDDIAAHICDEIKYLFLTDKLWEDDKKKYNQIKSIIDRVIKVRFNKISTKCHCLAEQDEHGICYLNTFKNIHIIIEGSEDEKTALIKESHDIKSLIDVVEDIKNEIQNVIKNIEHINEHK